MKTLIPLLIILILSACGQSNKSEKSKIEIYLVKSQVNYIDSIETEYYFFPTANQLGDSALIKDDEILGYQITQDTSKTNNVGQLYSLLLSKSGQEKLANSGNISLYYGLRFAITVNRQPIYGGYFWNFASSFGCDWITVIPCNTDKLPILRGLPYYYFTKAHSDPRNDQTLISAFKNTGRLITK